MSLREGYQEYLEIKQLEDDLKKAKEGHDWQTFLKIANQIVDRNPKYQFEITQEDEDHILLYFDYLLIKRRIDQKNLENCQYLARRIGIELNSDVRKVDKIMRDLEVYRKRQKNNGNDNNKGDEKNTEGGSFLEIRTALLEEIKRTCPKVEDLVHELRRGRARRKLASEKK